MQILIITLMILIGEGFSHPGFPLSDGELKNPFIPQLPIVKEKPPEIIEQPIVETPIQETTTPTAEIVEPPKPVITAPSLKINGLIWNSDMPQAIVNDQIVKLGDTIAGATIVGIHRQGIDITYAGEQFTIDPNPTDDQNKENPPP